VNARRCCANASLLAPSAIVALLPKCPACLAAYLALGTGVGVSVTAAAWLQAVAVVLGVVPLWLLGKQAARLTTAVLTTWGPAHRASSVDPAVTLRCE